MTAETVVYNPFKTVPLGDFLEELRFEFPDLPDELFRYYLVKAARIMARDGKLIRRRAIIRTQHCVTRYALGSPDGLEICGILSIKAAPCGGCEHSVTRYFVPPVTSCSCSPENASFDPQDNVLHLRSPFTEAAYHIELAVCPAKDACELPEIYMSEHLDTLVTGARAYILLIPNRPWTNLNLGQAYMNDFMERVSRSGIDTASHKMRGSLKMNFGRAL